MDNQTEDGVLTVEMELSVFCEVGVIETKRMVLISDWSERVVENPIPGDMVFAAMPTENGAANNAFWHLCSR